MASPEGKVKAKISRMLRDHGVWYTMPIQRGYTKPGVPDYLCLKDGLFFTIEAKAGKNRPSTAQKAEMKALRENGAITFVVNEDGLAGLKVWLQILHGAML